ncbi:MAG: prolyl oligopeptidase family serine peptidase [Bacteroidales bacterium]
MNIKIASKLIHHTFKVYNEIQISFFSSLILILFGCSRTQPPVAQIVNSQKVIQGIGISDPYIWMENLNDPKTMDYIAAENKYADNYFNHLADLKDKILKEFEDRDVFQNKWGTTPSLVGDYFYYSRILPGKDYPTHYRKMNEANPQEESVLDENLIAKGLGYQLRQFLASPDNSCYFYLFTPTGGDYKLIVKSFQDKSMTDSIVGPVTKALWSQDCKSIIYVRNKKEVLAHKLMAPVSQDFLMYSEKRGDLDVTVSCSGSGKYIFITSCNKQSNEWSFIPSDLRTTKPKLINPVKDGKKYFPNHFGSDFFLILSDSDNGLRKLCKAPINSGSDKEWTTVLEGNDSLYMNEFTVVEQKYLILFETKQLIAKLRLIDLTQSGKDNQITFKEPDGHFEFNYYDSKENRILFSFASLLTPYTTYNYSLKDRELTINRPPAVKDYQKGNYIAETLWAKSGDGTLIPVSLIHKNGMKRSDGNNPVYLEACGNYGNIVHSDFNAYSMSLLDRGFYIAVAHIRGGGEFGKNWWDAGKLLNKKNAVNDFIACAEFLINHGYTTKGMITAAGSRSAGMVIGAALNEHPDLFKTALLITPYFDILSDLTDSSVNAFNIDQRKEFGNPGNKQQFEYLYSYSPYYNIKKQDYPAMLFRDNPVNNQRSSSGAFKMLAKLRTTATGKKTFFGQAGHQDIDIDYMNKECDEFFVENYSFILDQYGIQE